MKLILISISLLFLLPGGCSALELQSVEVLVNKNHPIYPARFMPANLTTPGVPLASLGYDQEAELAAPAAGALADMLFAAKQAGISLMLSSGYRSYENQDRLYALNLALYGNGAKESVAYPGTSEHQTGLAADLMLTNNFCSGRGCFTVTKAADWLQHHSYKYGFVLRYPLHKETVTGYEYEPWHYRYVGVYLATTLYSRKQTLEEYYKTD